MKYNGTSDEAIAIVLIVVLVISLIVWLSWKLPGLPDQYWVDDRNVYINRVIPDNKYGTAPTFEEYRETRKKAREGFAMAAKSDQEIVPPGGHKE